MKRNVLEIAIIIRDWSLILDYWPQLNISETLFPPHLKHFTVELNEDLELLVYLIDTLSKKEYNLADRIIPFIPFSLLFISQLDAIHESLWQTYHQRYQTPLFFLAQDDPELKDKIVMREDLASKLSNVMFFNPEDSLTLSWGLISKQCLENLQYENTQPQQTEEESQKESSETDSSD